MRKHLIVLCHTRGHFSVLERFEQAMMNLFDLRIFDFLNDLNNGDALSLLHKAAYVLILALQ